MDSPALATTLQDIDGNYSSKRIAAFIALAFYLAGAVVDTVTPLHVPMHAMDGLLYIVGGGLALAVSERFAPRG